MKARDLLLTSQRDPTDPPCPPSRGHIGHSCLSCQACVIRSIPCAADAPASTSDSMSWGKCLFFLCMARASLLPSQRDRIDAATGAVTCVTEPSLDHLVLHPKTSAAR
ncbi:hypothetical protein WJX77_011489 [Trebouxia sp. C0004]